MINYRGLLALLVAVYCTFISSTTVFSRGDADRPAKPKEAMYFEKDIRPFLLKYCTNCHGADMKKADFVLHDITEGVADMDRWGRIVENIQLELMPPPEKLQPEDEMRFAVVDWINSLLEANNRKTNHKPISTQGNRVRHEDLFSGEHTGPAFSYPRTWRISQRIYDRISRMMGATRGKAGSKGPIPALVGVEGEAFKDYDLLLADDVTMRAMMLNFRELSKSVIDRHLNRLALLREESPGPETYDEAVSQSFKTLLRRQPNPEELDRYRGLLSRSVENSDPRTACQQMLMAILLSPEFMFRMELGTGEELGDGRRMLGSGELAFAIAYGLTDLPPDEELQKAVEEGRLKTRADVEREIRRMLSVVDNRDSWDYHVGVENGNLSDWFAPHNPRLLRFFQEFFGYVKADLVFKDKERNGSHSPGTYMRDADFMILDIIEKDEAVLETLLTTDQFILGHTPPRSIEDRLRGQRDWAKGAPMQRAGIAFREGRTPPLVDHFDKGATVVYGISFDEWDYPMKQPFKVENRYGFLTHPAWLTAWSGNFDNDIIRRGKWIREHLLADALPELPIGVDAKLPNDPHKTLRDRMQVTRVDECWRCHKLMDPLGMAFEEYDDFGRFRDGQIVLSAGEDQHRAAMYAYNQKRDRIKKEIQWKIGDSREIRQLKIAALRARIAGLEPPEKDHPNYEGVLKEQQHAREVWGKEIAKIEALPPRDEDEDKLRIAKLREQLATMTPPKPEIGAPVNAKGVLTGTRDPELDGEYDGVKDLMDRLVKSDRARQSFIRHIFRYFMGRNEMLSDSPTLMAMDKTYVESGGSFKEVIVTLMTSDSFLTRKDKD